jgi:hypothetical protein
MKIWIDAATGTWGATADLHIIDLDNIADNDGEDTDVYSYIAALDGMSDSEICAFGERYGNAVT